MKYLVRLQSVELENFKNVEKGLISITQGLTEKKYLKEISVKTLTSDVLGIYGQNGSGKSAVVDSLYFLKELLEGGNLDADTANFIQVGKDTFTCTFTFLLLSTEDAGSNYLITYSFCVKRDGDSFSLKSEQLKYQSITPSKKNPQKIISYDTEMADHHKKFMTSQNISFLKRNSKDNYKKLEAYLFLNKNLKESFIFGNQTIRFFLDSFENSLIREILAGLRRFASSYLFVFRNEYSARVMGGNEFQLTYSKEIENQRLLGQFIFRYSNGPVAVLLADLERWEKIINNINIVLKTIIPNMKIEIHEGDTDFTKDGKEFKKVHFFSSREGISIPLKYESDGIKKIISILGVIVDMYNNPTVTLVVDELDSGIFEYLLGEIVKIIEESGKGQFIFTSHNLRPLELLKYKSLYFTTVNPKNRYTQLSAIKTNNNVRKIYYTALQLGSDDDDLYEMVDDFQIKDALLESGKDTEVFNG